MSTTARKLELGRVGEVVKRVDAIPKVTGEFAYASDLFAAGMLWGHTVRSPHAHARIVEVDISEALTMAGVHAVLTHADVPGAKTYGLEFPDQPVLAIDKVQASSRLQHVDLDHVDAALHGGLEALERVALLDRVGALVAHAAIGGSDRMQGLFLPLRLLGHAERLAEPSLRAAPRWRWLVSVPPVSRPLTALACIVALLAAAGCGETDQEQAREVAQDYVEAGDTGDFEAVCASSRTSSSTSSRSPTARAS